MIKFSTAFLSDPRPQNFCFVHKLLPLLLVALIVLDSTAINDATLDSLRHSRIITTARYPLKLRRSRQEDHHPFDNTIVRADEEFYSENFPENHPNNTWEKTVSKSSSREEQFSNRPSEDQSDPLTNTANVHMSEDTSAVSQIRNYLDKVFACLRRKENGEEPYRQQQLHQTTPIVMSRQPQPDCWTASYDEHYDVSNHTALVTVDADAGMTPTWSYQQQQQQEDELASILSIDRNSPFSTSLATSSVSVSGRATGGNDVNRAAKPAIDFQSLDQELQSVDPRIRAKTNVNNIPSPFIPTLHLSSQQLYTFTNQSLPHPYTTVVTCPKGWMSIGPYCVTVAQTPPFTQCPDYRTRYHPGSWSTMEVIEPGLCQYLIKTGVKIDCPSGFSPQTIPEAVMEDNDRNGDDSAITSSPMRFSCHRKSHFIPINSLLTDGCPLGYRAIPGGCDTVEQQLPPTLGCERPSELGMKPVNEFAIKKKDFIECVEAIRHKGHLSCPDGFHLYNHPYPEFQFGDFIPLSTHRTVWNDVPDYLGILDKTEDRLADPAEPLSGHEHGGGIRSRDDSALCIKVMAVFHTRCTEFACRSPVVQSTAQAIRYWSDHQLYVDPVAAVSEGIPKGNNLRWTTPNIRKTFP